jgi:porin
MRRRIGRGFGLAIVTFVAGSALLTGRAQGQTPVTNPPPVVVLQEPVITAAPEPAPPPSPYTGSLLERSKVTGDWFGARTNLAAKGLTFDGNITQFYQGVTSGGAKEGFAYGGHLDYFLNLDGEKAGLWKGFFVTLHGETLYGESANPYAGTLLPISLGQVLPAPGQNITALTGVKFTQFLSENFLVYAGKINLLDELKQPYATGRGYDAFMNTSFLFNPIFARSVPYSTYGAGFAVLKDLHPIFGVSVFDTNNTSTNSGFNTFFDNGAVVVGQVSLPVKLMGLPGHQGIIGTYSSGRYTSLDQTGFLNRLVTTGVAANRETGTWSVGYQFDQALVVSSDDPTKSWGLFGNAGYSDGNPNPIRWTANLGVGGSSFLPGRKLDTFGAGYFQVGVSSALKNLAPRLLPLRDEHGLEFFYNVAVTPWCHLTPDFQVVLPSRERNESAVAVGIRAKIDF